MTDRLSATERRELLFRVADADFRVVFHGSEDRRPLIDSCYPFFQRYGSTGEPPIFTLDVDDNLLTPEPEGTELGQFDCGGINHGVYRFDERAGGGYKIVIGSTGGAVSCALRANADFSRCTASLFGDAASQAFGLGNALMLCFSFAGAYHDILLIHASVPMLAGSGYPCLGVSGTGKSTHRRNWERYIPGVEMLNDDNPALRVVGDDIYIYGTPWSGKTPCYRNVRQRLGGFIRLEQAPANELQRLSKLQTFVSILNSASTMMWDKPSYDRITATCSRIAESVPAVHLKNLPDREAVLLSYRALVLGLWPGDERSIETPAEA